MRVHNLLLLGATIFLASCSQQQQARKPISHSSGTFIKESIERNKILIADEEDLIAEIIKKDSLESYIASTKGYWYKYETKVDATTPTPKRGDIAFFDYEIKDLKNRIIYIPKIGKRFFIQNYLWACQKKLRQYTLRKLQQKNYFLIN